MANETVVTASTVPPTTKLTVVTAVILVTALEDYVSGLQAQALTAYLTSDDETYRARMIVLSQALPLLSDLTEALPEGSREMATAYFRRMDGRCEECGSNQHATP